MNRDGFDRVWVGGEWSSLRGLPADFIYFKYLRWNGKYENSVTKLISVEDYKLSYN